MQNKPMTAGKTAAAKPSIGSVVRLNRYGMDAVYGNRHFGGDCVVVDHSYNDNLIVAPKGNEGAKEWQRHVRVSHIV